MMMAKGFMSPCNLQSLLSPLPHFKIPPKPHLKFLSNSSSFFEERNGVCAFALKKKKNGKEKNSSVVEIKDFDDELDFNENDDFEIEDGDEDDEDEGFALPLENMKKWLENRPPGFGQGKAYDTSIEDKLFDEIEQSKEAQLININKLKSNPILVNSKVKQQKLPKAPEDIPSGICVRLSTLPKKKNIHKNLKVAFKEIPGILKISPAVSGNEKTRDPVCKGFAYIYLRSEQDANRFIEVFSKQSITFGKIEKLIKCEIVNPPRSDNDESTVRNPVTPKTRLPRVEEVSVPANSYKPTSSSNTSVETISDESDGSDDSDDSENSDDLDHGRVDSDWEEESSENWESFNTGEKSNDENVKPKSNFVIDSSTSEKMKKIRLLEKKLLDKKKGGKEELKESIESLSTPKPKSSSAFDSLSSSSENTKKIRSPEKKKADKKKGGKVAMVSALGSAKGLKMKEKALLAGVLSKYAENVSRNG